uniref:Uncharacterized protein n=1 Tax=Rhizophora mucronata TaxID=61149 RepID=A0A2P2NP34_RHIMU
MLIAILCSLMVICVPLMVCRVQFTWELVACSEGLHCMDLTLQILISFSRRMILLLLRHGP